MNTVPTVTKTRRWPQVLLISMAVLGIATLVLVGWALSAVVDAPMSVTVNGIEHWPPMALSTLPPAHKVVLLLGLALTALAIVVVVPVALLLAFAGVLLAALLGVGLPVIILLAVAAVLLSPLVLIGWGLWALLRPSRPEAEASGTATIST